MTKVFLVEDDEALNRLYKTVFELNNYEVEATLDGSSALRQLEGMKQKPEVILLDIMMPKMSGFEFLQQVKSKQDLKDIKIVVLSNLAQQEDIDKAVALGADLYLVKSQHDPQAVVSKVKDLIKTNEQ